MTRTLRLSFETHGDTHVIDITTQVQQAIGQASVRDGIAVVFVIGSTAAITTTEAEPGLVNHDLKAFYDRIAPDDIDYRHEQTWGDDNGHAHVRASSLGPSIAVPLVGGRLTLGQWQQVVLIDFDTRPRRREVVVQLVGE
jgi:secondary thiamine-phosphate synthase enzyme